MALIVEDGSIVANANSYVTRDELITYAASRGVVLANDDATDYMAVEAIDYMELFAAQFKGVMTDPVEQFLAWPRDGVVIGPVVVGKNTIPRKIKEAQCALVLVVRSGVKLIPTKDYTKQTLIRSKLGPIEKEYATTTTESTPALPSMPGVEALLAPFLYEGGGPTRTYRA